jgi:hypothetical protein
MWEPPFDWEPRFDMQGPRPLVDPERDVIWGQDHTVQPGWTGNYKFKKFVWNGIATILLDAQMNHVPYDEAGWDVGVHTIVDNYRQKEGNENVVFFIAITGTFIVVVQEEDSLLALVRQLASDCFVQMLHLEDPNDLDVLSYEEVRLKWFSTFEPGRQEHILLRLFDECPVREEILELYVIPHIFSLSPDEWNDVEDLRMNTYYMPTHTVTLRQYKTVGTYGVRDYILSENLSMELNQFLERKGIYTDEYPDKVDGWNQLFPLHVTTNTIIDWFRAAGLRDHSPFNGNVGEEQGTFTMISALRKCFQSITHYPRRTIAPHLLYMNGNTNYPTFLEMCGLQLHSVDVALDEYTFQIQQVLNSELPN